MTKTRTTTLQNLVIVALKVLTHLNDRFQQAAQRRAEKAQNEKYRDQPENQTEVILARLRNLSEIHTQSVVVQTVAASERKNRIKWLVTGRSRLLYVATGEVRAGVDLSAVRVSEGHSQEGLTISLPRAKLLSAYIDVNKSYVYDVAHFGPCGAELARLQSDTQRTALEEIKKTALEQGILEEADSRAEYLIRQFLQGFSNTPVRIVFQ